MITRYKLNIIGFAISLTGVEFGTIYGHVNISEVVVLIVSLIILVKNKAIFVNKFSYYQIVFIIFICLPGVYHSIFNQHFSLVSHFKMVIKCMIILLMTLSLPFFISKISKFELFKIILIVANIHGVFLIFDSVFYSPFDWDDSGIKWNERDVDYNRARGFFGESSRFAISQTILMSTLLFLDEHALNKNLSSVNFLFIIFTIILSSSVYGFVVSIVFIFQFFYSYKNYSKSKSILSLLFGFCLSIILFYFSPSYEYLMDRSGSLFSSFSDGSTRGRIIGGWLSVSYVFENNPFFGFGAGSINIHNQLDMSLINSTYSDSSAAFGMTNTTFWTALAIGYGLFPMLIISYMFMQILFKRYFYYFITMLSLTIASGLYYLVPFWGSLIIFFYYTQFNKSNNIFHT